MDKERYCQFCKTELKESKESKFNYIVYFCYNRNCIEKEII